MFPTEQQRRKNPSSQHLKTVFSNNSHTSLLSTIDKKRSDLSKQKVKCTQMPQYSEPSDLKANAALINFRNIKNTQNVSSHTQPVAHKNSKDCFQLKVNKKQPQPSSNGIQINVNIQNMLPNNRKQHLTEAISDRSVSRKKKEQLEKVVKRYKKNDKIVMNTSAFQEFECNEELEFRPERRTEKKMVFQPQQPLIERNQMCLLTTASAPKNRNNPEVNDYQRQIRQFEAKMEMMGRQSQAEALCFLDSRQLCYQIDPLYIEKRQKQLTWLMRGILMDWMMHISFEFKLKRQTLHIALTLVDNFFMATLHLSKAEFQLTGAAALFIAAKLQEFEPLSSRQFSKSTKDRYSAEEIRSMEERIVTTLKYNLNPPTINMWANRLMQQWDLFLESFPDPYAHLQPCYFKKVDQECYKNYREMMQILDCAILDIQTVQYKPKILVCSLLYLQIGKELGQFNKKKIVTEFPRTSRFFLSDTSFNSLFSQFLSECLGLEMYELLPSVQYLATYFTLPLSYERPCLKNQEEEVQGMHLEEYCSYQTYNANMLATVKKRFRGIYE